MTKPGVISVFLAGEKLVPSEVSTVVNTRMRAVSLERHCSGEDVSSLLCWEYSSNTPESSYVEAEVEERQLYTTY